MSFRKNNASAFHHDYCEARDKYYLLIIGISFKVAKHFYNLQHCEGPKTAADKTTKIIKKCLINHRNYENTIKYCIRVSTAQSMLGELLIASK